VSNTFDIFHPKTIASQHVPAGGCCAASLHYDAEQLCIFQSNLWADFKAQNIQGIVIRQTFADSNGSALGNQTCELTLCTL